MADTAPVIIWVTDPDRLCTFVNKRWLDFVGRTFEQEVGFGWADSMHPEDRDRSIGDYILWFDARRSFQMEYRVRRADGEYRWLLDHGAPFYREGEFAGYIGSCTDITDQKQVVERLRGSETRLKDAQHLAKIGSFERNLEDDKAYWSDEMFRIYGLVNDTPPSTTALLNCVYPNDRQKLVEAHEQVRANNAPVDIEFRIVRPDGEVRYARTILEAVRDDRGAVVHMVGATQDVTDLKRAQEESVARQKLESLGTLASGIAHDFNNLLGSILAQTELAHLECADGAPPDEELSTVRKVAIRGSEIVRQLMIYAGKDIEVYTHIDLSQVVEEMLALMRVSVSKHAALETNLVGGLPPVWGSAAQLRQVVMNLVTNASEALGDRDGVIRVTTGGVTVTPDATVSEGVSPGEYVQLEVSDTGCGISLETQARIFDPFFTTKSSGRGLGLSVVDGIVRNFGGVIQLTSHSGKGATFEYCCRAPNPHPRQPPTRFRPRRSRITGSPKAPCSLWMMKIRFERVS
jgi:PAS domain S-box-containing protein